MKVGAILALALLVASIAPGRSLSQKPPPGEAGPSCTRPR
jgi:hypothetical protein